MLINQKGASAGSKKCISGQYTNQETCSADIKATKEHCEAALSPSSYQALEALLQDRDVRKSVLTQLKLLNTQDLEEDAYLDPDLSEEEQEEIRAAQRSALRNVLEDTLRKVLKHSDDVSTVLEVLSFLALKGDPRLYLLFKVIVFALRHLRSIH